MNLKWRMRINFLTFILFIMLVCFTDAPRFELYFNTITLNLKNKILNEATTPTIESVATSTPTPSATPTPTIGPTPATAWNRSYSGEGLPVFNDQSGDFLQIIKEAKEYYAYNGFNYCMCPGKRKIPAENSFKTSCSKHKVRGSYVTDCSTYVSWVLHEYGLSTGRWDLAEYFSSQRNSGAFHRIARDNGGEFFEVIWNVADCKPGDILIYSGHVEFFQEFDVDGTPIVWSCGSGKFVNHGYPERTRKTVDKIAKILRLKMN